MDAEFVKKHVNIPLKEYKKLEREFESMNDTRRNERYYPYVEEDTVTSESNTEVDTLNNVMNAYDPAEYKIEENEKSTFANNRNKTCNASEPMDATQSSFQEAFYPHTLKNAAVQDEQRQTTIAPNNKRRRGAGEPKAATPAKREKKAPTSVKSDVTTADRKGKAKTPKATTSTARPKKIEAQVSTLEGRISAETTRPREDPDMLRQLLHLAVLCSKHYGKHCKFETVVTISNKE